MAVSIVRRTGWIGMGGGITIKINGKKIQKVKSEQKIEVNIPNGKAQLKVTQFGNRSNELEINDGETIEITSPKWSSFIFFLMIIIPSLINFVPSFQYRTISMIIYAVFVLIILFGKNWYQIKKI